MTNLQSVSVESSTCQCKNPPGGIVKCEPGQTPICIVRADGTIEGKCLNPPKTRLGIAEFRDWLYDELLACEPAIESLTSAEFDKMLVNEQFELPNGTNIRFRLPPRA